MSAGGLFLEGFLGSDDVVLDDVIAKDDANLLAFDEGLGEPKRVRDAAFAFLISVMNAMQIEVLPIGVTMMMSFMPASTSVWIG